MKKFLILLLLFFIPKVKAEETWAKVGQSMFAPIPGTLANEKCAGLDIIGISRITPDLPKLYPNFQCLGS